MKRSIEKMKEECSTYFEALAKALEDTHEVVESCNGDFSKYLIPKGSIADLTYYGKPANSYRISDHWNWFSNVKRCQDEHYIQCYSPDLPWARKRETEGTATKPIRATCVAYYGSDAKYHVIFGEKFNRITKEWSWEAPEVACVISN